MTLIQVTAIILPCAVALLVVYWHRKQMRQNELFRLDPSVGLIPPPSPPVAFFKRYRGLIVGIGGPLLTLALWLAWSRNSPVTNVSVMIISLNIIAIFFAVRHHGELSAEQRLLNLLEKHIDVTHNAFDKVFSVLDVQASRTFAALEKQVREGSSRSGTPTTPSDGPDRRAP
jgi:hypothetical protein